MDFSSYFPIWNKLTPTQQQILEQNAVLEETNILNITHETIAGHMGTAREIVTRMLRYFQNEGMVKLARGTVCLLYTSPSPRDSQLSRMPSSA